MVIPIWGETTWEELDFRTPGEFLRFAWDILQMMWYRARANLYLNVEHLKEFLGEWWDGYHKGGLYWDEEDEVHPHRPF